MPCDPDVSPSLRSFSMCPDPVSTRRASGLGFVGQPSNPADFVVNRRKPHVQTPVVSRYSAPAPIDDFVLLFLPPCGPHLTPLATGSLESGLLVSPLLGGPARHRPFVPTLHLHQHKSSRNLHLQYSAKSQSTPRCQSLITARCDHPPVLGRSGPQERLPGGEEVLSFALCLPSLPLSILRPTLRNPKGFPHHSDGLGPKVRQP
jgi:hypothetical protein